MPRCLVSHRISTQGVNTLVVAPLRHIYNSQRDCSVVTERNNVEVEVKFRLTGVMSKWISELVDGGFTEKGSFDQTDLYYNHPSRDFCDTDEALRVRTLKSGETTLSYKGPKVSSRSKARLELNLEVSSSEVIDNILVHLGFIPSGVVKKTRRLFISGDNIQACLDNVDDLGLFLELESMGNEANLARTEELLMRTAQGLGLDPDSQLRISYLEMILSKRNRDNSVID